MINRETDDEPIVLDNRAAEVRRAGAIQYALYIGSGNVGGLYEKFNGTAKSVNGLLMKDGKSDYNSNVLLDDEGNSEVFSHADNDEAASADTSAYHKDAAPVPNLMDNDVDILDKVIEADVLLDIENDCGTSNSLPDSLKPCRNLLPGSYDPCFYHNLQALVFLRC